MGWETFVVVVVVVLVLVSEGVGELREKIDGDVFGDEEFMKCKKCGRLSIPKQRFHFVANVAFIDKKEIEKEQDLFDDVQSESYQECLNHYDVSIKDSPASELFGLTAKECYNLNFDYKTILGKRFYGLFKINNANQSFSIQLESVYNIWLKIRIDNKINNFLIFI